MQSVSRPIATFRLAPKRWDRSAALTSRCIGSETALLTRDDNLVGLMAVNRDLIGQAETCDRSGRTVLDMDSSVRARYTGSIRECLQRARETVCYHPLFRSPITVIAWRRSRPGNVSSADDWEELLVPVIDRKQAEGQRVAFWADAAFARPRYEALEARGVQYAIRVPANKNRIRRWRSIDLLFRSPGRPSHQPMVRYKSVRYQA